MSKSGRIEHEGDEKMVLMGCYKTKDGSYVKGVISKEKIMDKHTDSSYCVILEVETFQIKQDPITGDRPIHKVDKFYLSDEIDHGEGILKKKFRNGSWETY